jgi:hypothetical protein
MAPLAPLCTYCEASSQTCYAFQIATILLSCDTRALCYEKLEGMSRSSYFTSQCASQTERFKTENSARHSDVREHLAAIVDVYKIHRAESSIGFHDVCIHVGIWLPDCLLRPAGAAGWICCGH